MKRVFSLKIQMKGFVWRRICRNVLVSLLSFSLLLTSAEIVCARTSGVGLPSAYLPKISSYLQVRYTDAYRNNEDRLALRRFKAVLNGGPLDKLHYHLQFIYKANNGSRTDYSVFLQDADFMYPLGRGLSLKIGQFVPPFGLERFQPDWNLDFVDRTDVTNRLAINGTVGESFARDRGIECDWNHHGWKLSGGLFRGAGTDIGAHGNGPLGVGRMSYGQAGNHSARQWLWRAGVAGAIRRDTDLDFSSQLPGVNKDLTRHFQGQDRRLNVFTQVGLGPLRAQGEYFRVWFDPTSGRRIVATGTYGQVAYLPVKSVILALRYEWFSSDALEQTASSFGQWTTGVTYDLPWLPLRIATDYSWSHGRKEPEGLWRVQVQYFLAKGFGWN